MQSEINYLLFVYVLFIYFLFIYCLLGFCNSTLPEFKVNAFLYLNNYILFMFVPLYPKVCFLTFNFEYFCLFRWNLWETLVSIWVVWSVCGLQQSLQILLPWVSILANLLHLEIRRYLQEWRQFYTEELLFSKHIVKNPVSQISKYHGDN